MFRSSFLGPLNSDYLFHQPDSLLPSFSLKGFVSVSRHWLKRSQSVAAAAAVAAAIAAYF